MEDPSRAKLGFQKVQLELKRAKIFDESLILARQPSQAKNRPPSRKKSGSSRAKTSWLVASSTPGP